MTPDTMTSVGLCIGQRPKQFVPCTKGSGWYNERGEWIGWGNLTTENMTALAEVLSPKQLFIVLHEENAFRRFLRNLLPDYSGLGASEDAPGQDYVMLHALFVISQNEICRVDDVYPLREHDTKEGIRYRIVGKNVAREMILACSRNDEAVLA